MAEISQIKLPNGDTFDLVDEKSGYITVETDPVFSASAAAGITSTDISNWNAKSDTDNKVATNAMGTTSWYYIVTGTNTTSAETKYYSTKIGCGVDDESVLIYLGDTDGTEGHLRLYSSSSGASVTLFTSGSGSNYISFPGESGTVALTSDIPSVYSSTNTGGYLTMATLPIYNGTVE